MTIDVGGDARAVIVMNTRSGGGKVRRFGLIEHAERLGATVAVVTGDHDAASLARQAVERGARVIGAAGGDGTVSAVAAVAADADRPLLVIPAGTRNHFARDLSTRRGRRSNAHRRCWCPTTRTTSPRRPGSASGSRPVLVCSA